MDFPWWFKVLFLWWPLILCALFGLLIECLALLAGWVIDNKVTIHWPVLVGVGLVGLIGQVAWALYFHG